MADAFCGWLAPVHSEDHLALRTSGAEGGVTGLLASASNGIPNPQGMPRQLLRTTRDASPFRQAGIADSGRCHRK